MLPVFRSSILLPGGLAAKCPDSFEPFDQPGFALKMERTGFATDYSFSVVHGYYTLPGLTLRPDGSLAFINSEFLMLGADFATTGEVWGFRGEIAYIDFLDEGRFFGRTGPQDFVYAVLGVEREVLETSNLIVQGLFRHILDFTPSGDFPPGQADLAAVNNAIFGQFRQTEPGLMASLTSRFLRDTLRTEIGGATFLGEPSGALRAKATYQITDQPTVAGVASVFVGPDESIFGVISDTSRLFVELRHAF